MSQIYLDNVGQKANVAIVANGIEHEGILRVRTFSVSAL